MIYAHIVKNDYHRPLTTRDLMMSEAKSSDIILTLKDGSWMVIPREWLKKDGTIQRRHLKAIEKLRAAA